jgi:hypothetical protein
VFSKGCSERKIKIFQIFANLKHSRAINRSSLKRKFISEFSGWAASPETLSTVFNHVLPLCLSDFSEMENCLASPFPQRMLNPFPPSCLSAQVSSGPVLMDEDCFCHRHVRVDCQKKKKKGHNLDCLSQNTSLFERPSKLAYAITFLSCI